MNSFFAAACLLFATPSLAAPASFSCERTSKGDLIETKALNVTISASEVEFKLDFFGKTKAVTAKATGKTASNGAFIYDGSDLTELLDQSDLGNIFVDPSLLAGRDGKLGFSVRQLGDSEGSWWVSDSFRCVARK